MSAFEFFSEPELNSEKSVLMLSFISVPANYQTFSHHSYVWLVFYVSSTVCNMALKSHIFWSKTQCNISEHLNP